MFPIKKSQSWLPSIFNDFLDNEWAAKPHQSGPAINIIECDKRYKVEVATPGMTKDDFNIEIRDDNQLIVTMEKSGEDMNKPKEPVAKKETMNGKEGEMDCEHSYCTPDDEEIKNSKFLRREFIYSQYRQTLILPDNVDRALISAKQENGILTISLPKKDAYIKAQSTKKITVE